MTIKIHGGGLAPVSTTLTRLSAVYEIPAGFTPDDVLSTVISNQHERSPLMGSTVRRLDERHVSIQVVAFSGIGKAEIEDMADRMANPGPGVSTDTVTVVQR